MNFDYKNLMNKFDLNQNNCIVIGSGILEVRGLRKANHIDLVVQEEAFANLFKSGKFELNLKKGRKILKNDIFEIGQDWFILGKSFNFKDLVKESEIINEIRFIKLSFLLKIKKSWVKEGSSRPKDLSDIEIIEKFLKNSQSKA